MPRYHLIQKITILLLALFLPASGISFLFLYQTNQKLEKQTLTAIHEGNAAYMDRLDENLQQLYRLDYQLMENYDWIQFQEKTSVMSDYDRFSFINSLRGQLTLIKDIHPLLESVHIYFPDAAAVIAATVNYNETYVSRLFKQRTGMKISDYIQQERLAKAKQLLSTTDQSINAIAESCGFDSIHYFSYTFKKNVGVSPSEYKRNRKA